MPNKTTGTLFERALSLLRTYGGMPLTTNDVATELGTSTKTMLPLLKRMENLELVTCGQDPDHIGRSFVWRAVLPEEGPIFHDARFNPFLDRRDLANEQEENAA